MKDFAVDGDTGKVQIWDTAGDDRYWDDCLQSCRLSDGVLLVYDVTKAHDWNAQRLNHWFESIRAVVEPDAVVLVVGNKCDLRDGDGTSTEEGFGFATSHGFLFTETSAKDAPNVEEVFTRLVTEIVHRHLSQDKEE